MSLLQGVVENTQGHPLEAPMFRPWSVCVRPHWNRGLSRSQESIVKPYRYSLSVSLSNSLCPSLSLSLCVSRSRSPSRSRFRSRSRSLSPSPSLSLSLSVGLSVSLSLSEPLPQNASRNGQATLGYSSNSCWPRSPGPLTWPGALLRGVLHGVNRLIGVIWEFPTIRGTFLGGPYNTDPTI